MRECGIVTKTDKEFAIVKVDKKDECSKCGMCIFPKNANSIDFNAVNQVNASVGDTVIIETEKDTKLIGAILVFLIPLILIGLSCAITYLFLSNEIWVLILSVIFLFLWYTILAVIDKRLKHKADFCAKIVSIITKKGENKDE